MGNSKGQTLGKTAGMAGAGPVPRAMNTAFPDPSCRSTVSDLQLDALVERQQSAVQSLAGTIGLLQDRTMAIVGSWPTGEEAGCSPSREGTICGRLHSHTDEILSFDALLREILAVL